MKKIVDARHSRRYRKALLWSGLFIFSLLFTVFLESLCVGIVYLTDSLKGKDTSRFVEKHILTSPFPSKLAGPVPGKHFLGYLPIYTWEFLIPDDLLGWRLASNVSVYYREEYGNEFLYVTDNYGFSVDVNDPPIAIDKSPDVYRVIVLGGSTVMGEGAPWPSQNIVAMLRKNVRERQLTGPNGRHIQFINAGVVSYNSSQEYLYFVTDLLAFKPDLVVVYDGWNDSLRGNWSFLTDTYYELNRRIAESYSTRGSLSR